MAEFLNSFCGVTDSHHTSKCSHPGVTTYDTLSGKVDYVCAKKATWHDQPTEHGEICQNLCAEHARAFRKIGRLVEPYKESVGWLQNIYVERSPISWKSLIFPVAILGYVIYANIRY